MKTVYEARDSMTLSPKGEKNDKYLSEEKAADQYKSDTTKDAHSFLRGIYRDDYSVESKGIENRNTSRKSACTLKAIDPYQIKEDKFSFHRKKDPSISYSRISNEDLSVESDLLNQYLDKLYHSIGKKTSEILLS